MDLDLVVMEGDREGRLFASGMTLALLVALAPVVLGLGIVAVNMSFWFTSWALWLLMSLAITLARLVYAVWVVSHVMLDIMLLSSMKTAYTIYRRLPFVAKITSVKRQKLSHAESYEHYMKLAAEVDAEEGTEAWRRDDSDLPQAEVLRMITAKLDEALAQRDVIRLQFTLHNGLLKRNHLGVDERALHLRALAGTKIVVDDYIKKVVECLDFLSDCDELSREAKLRFFAKARKSLGKTALMLSGGGAIAMYHLGVVRALIKLGLLKYISVISGTSGGSIIAGLLALLSEKDLMEKALVKEVVCDYGNNGQMKKLGISWFPPVHEQIRHFIKNGVLIDNESFARTCEYYYGDATFAEGFKATGRHVCISVSASTFNTKFEGGPRRLLLNHITTPNVLIRSAVAASCSLPGIMKPNKLLCKDQDGRIHPFELDGVQYVDGSLQADLPFRRISAMFGVSHFIVSQVNFHVVPFLHKPHSPDERSVYWRLFRFLDSDIRHRALSLAELGLLPRVFGQDLSGVFKQKYFGHVTIVPKFRMSEMIGLSAFTNPTMDEMRHYIGNGERFAWPFISHIQHNTAIERVISDALSRLRSGSLASLPPLGVRTGSDVSEGTESDEEEEEGSEGPRSQDGEVKVLAQPSKVALDEENKALRKEVERLRTLLAQASVGEHDRQARRRRRVAPGGQVLEEEEPGLVSNKQAAH